LHHLNAKIATRATSPSPSPGCPEYLYVGDDGQHESIGGGQMLGLSRTDLSG
jgi:hypothetical protein